MNNQLAQNRVTVRSIILSANYENVQDYLSFRPKILKDTQQIFKKYSYFYPISQQKPTLKGKVSILIVIGNMTITNNQTKKPESIKIKITFPREYPREPCYITLPNPDQTLYTRNTFYQKNSLATYEKSPNDQKWYLSLRTPELKNWNINTDILKVIMEIEKRLNQNFPFEKNLNTNRLSSSAGFNKGNQFQNQYPNQYQNQYQNQNQYQQNQYQNQNQNNNIQNEALKSEIQATQNQYMQLEGDFELLIKKRIGLNFNYQMGRMMEHQLVHKTKQLQRYITQVKKMSESCEKLVLNHSTLDNFIECNEETKKQIQLISEKEALQQCHNYLKQQLKNGVKLSTIRQSLKKLYEQMFVNQFYINQL